MQTEQCFREHLDHEMLILKKKGYLKSIILVSIFKTKFKKAKEAERRK